MANAVTNHKRRSFVFPKEHASVTADTTIKIFKARKRTVIDRVDYINVTGLAEDATNVFAISVLNGATVVADGINTDSDAVGADNSLAANTFVTLTNGSRANRTLAAGNTLSALLDEGGTATLPAGTFIVWFTEV